MNNIQPKIILNMQSVINQTIIDTSLDVEIFGVNTKEALHVLTKFLIQNYVASTLIIVKKGANTHNSTLAELAGIQPVIDSVLIKGTEGVNKLRYCMGDLIRIIARLTGENGCPWDKEQTHKSIRINMVEEAYEAVDAINNNDLNAMREELGDVMLQTVLHADIAKRNKTFTLEDIIDGLCTKLVSRHTHIFGENVAQNSSDALSFWEQAKGKEKSYNTLKDKLNSYPDTFSSALLAQKTFSKISKEYKLDSNLLQRTFDRYMGGEDVGTTLIFLLIGLEGLKHNDTEVDLRKLCKEVALRVENAGTIEELLK